MDQSLSSHFFKVRSTVRAALMWALPVVILFVALPGSQLTGVAHPLEMALFGYGLTVAIELPILLFALSPRHTVYAKLTAAVWLTACTYPMVAWFIPSHLQSLALGAPLLLTVLRESFAAAGECALFWVAFIRWCGVGQPGEGRQALARDFAAIILANLASFIAGELLKGTGFIWPMLSWFGLA